MAAKKLKDWFDTVLAKQLADKIHAVDAAFDKKGFVKAVSGKVEQLELKDRVEHIADCLFEYLGEDYSNGMQILLQILGPENTEETGMFTNFYWVMPIAKYAEKYGLDNFKLSMQAIEEVTKRNTGEYAIRPYLEQNPKKTLAVMKKWSKNGNSHLRRLSCEGLRPRLPWAKKLQVFIDNPTDILPILNNLKDDSSKYVQKSVANCINDILKDNPDIGQSLIESWIVKDIGKARKWIIKHALRNLLKANDSWASKIMAQMGG